jgi:nudix-type nucleoside diphosphatase (YffH/AdpP family)
LADGDAEISLGRVEVIHQGWTRLVVARVALPDGTLLSREVEDHGDGVAVLPYDAERRTAIVVEQLRAPVLLAAGEPALLEAIAGVIDDGAADDAARREAMEEAGLRLARLEPVAVGWSMPGISTERMHLFLAPYTRTDRTAAGGGLAEETERITVIEMSLAELTARIFGRAPVDLKTLALVQALMLRRPDLFPQA